MTKLHNTTTITFNGRDIVKVPTELAFTERIGTWKARWNMGRMHYFVEPGLYAIGNPTDRSDVLVSANYKMSFDRLRVSMAGRDAWILVLDTDGINVWCAAGKGTFGTDELVISSDSPSRSGKRKRLMQLLEKEAQENACSLDRIESLCKEYQLDWTWVEQQLTGLSNSGELIFPKPWTVLLVGSPEETQVPKIPDSDVTNEILAFLRQGNVSLHIDKILEYFIDGGITTKSVESSLEKLMRKGEIFEPKPGYLQLI